MEGHAPCEGIRDAERVGSRWPQEVGSTDEIASHVQRNPEQVLKPCLILKAISQSLTGEG